MPWWHHSRRVKLALPGTIFSGIHAGRCPLFLHMSDQRGSPRINSERKSESFDRKPSKRGEQTWLKYVYTLQFPCWQ